MWRLFVALCSCIPLVGCWLPFYQFSFNKYPYLNLSHSFQLSEPRKAQESTESKVERLGLIFKRNVRKLREKSHSLDLVFLVDESSSVGNVNFNNELKFVKKLLSDFPVLPSATRVAIVTFSSKNHVLPRVDYISSSHSHQHKCSLLNHEIPAISYKGGGTYTKGAFQQAAQILEKSNRNATKVIFLITDGYSNGGDPRPTATSLRDMGVEIFTFGIWQGNIRELHDMASFPKEEHCYFVHNFAEFEALARRALHEDLPSGSYIQEDISHCSSLCDAGQDCCDVMASCKCGTRSGQYDCVCEKGYYGKGLQNECTACPPGTYKPEATPGGISSCTPCPDKHHTSPPGSTAVKDCVCKNGYSPVGQSCQVVHCPEIKPPEHGYFIQNVCNNHFNAACGIRCKAGFDLIGSSIRLCQPSGEWSGSEATCRARLCPRIIEPKHGHINCTTRDVSYRTVCQVNCEDGYQLRGPTKLTCQVNSQWDGPPPQCLETQCPALEHSKTYVFMPSSCGEEPVKVGTECFLRCKPGYTNSGIADKIQCLSSGKWNTSIKKGTCRDSEPPQMTCPKDIVTETMEHQNIANISWIVPHGKDNSNEQVSIQVTPAFIPPHTFPIGEIRITYTATDRSGNRANCSFKVKVVDAEPPVIDKCRSPPPLQTVEREVSVQWEEPQFSDNSGFPLIITKTHSPGDHFPHGETLVKYTATDSSGNSRTCDLHIIIKGSACEHPFNPINGKFSCVQDESGVNCTLFCMDGYGLMEETAQSYFCAHDGLWKPPYSADWPDCSVNRFANNGFKPFEMLFKASRCDDMNLMEAFTEKFSTALGNMVPTFCSDADEVKCRLETIRNGRCLEYNYDYENGFAISPGGWGKSWNPQNVLDYAQGDQDYQQDQAERFSPKTAPLRIRRQTKDLPSTADQKIQIIFNISASIPLPKERNDSLEGENQKKLLQALEHITNRLKRTLDKEPLYSFQMVSETITADTKSLESKKATLFCQPGSVLKGRMCVNCPIGTYYSLENLACESCWIGAYQDEEGQLECKSCPEGSSTVYMHSRSLADCKAQCKPGTYSFSGLETCESCPLGKFQPAFASKLCVPCPEGMSTVNRGAVDVSECGVPCPAGEFSRSGLAPCYPCPQDYYQPDAGRSYCLSCPFYGTTSKSGATSIQDCSSFGSSYTAKEETLLLPVVEENISNTYQASSQVFHECFLNPCQNRGTCEEVGAGYICLCPSGFTGAKCESDIDECLSMPCQNGAICTDVVGNFSCQCQPGYVGTLCETEINECISAPCVNDGTCVDGINGYTCNCANGYTGIHCELELNECHSNPCLNNGVCEDLPGTFKCTCPTGLSGVKCEININECDSQPCLNGGVCSDGINNFRCQCKAGYTGLLCETDIDECEANQCLNQATCVDGLNSFTCKCPPGFNGTRCETEMSSNFDLEFAVSGIYTYVILENVMPLLSAITCTFWMKSSDGINYGTPISYAVEGSDNAFLLIDYNGWVLYINGKERITDCPSVNDGKWHHIGVTWNNTDGDWKVYIDGKMSDGGKGLAVDSVIPGGGSLVLGQDQDLKGEGFNPVESFVGSISQMNVWDYVLLPEQIKALASSCPKELHRGNLFAWSDFLKGTLGRVKVVTDSIFCADCPDLQTLIPHLQTSSRSVAPGSQVKLSCNPGYYLQGNETQQCLNLGQWNQPLPTCERVTCGPPPSLKNGSYKAEGFHTGSMVTYQCNRGFYLLGDSRAVCGDNGIWNSNTPSCLDVDECAVGSDCDKHSECHNTYGSYTCTCRHPYTGDGKNCTEPVKCPNPGSLEFGLVNGTDFTAGQKVYFSCKEGYHLIGATHITCLEFGIWSEHAPHCQVVNCGKPTIPENAIMKGSDYTYGNKVIFSCNTGFVLMGQAEIICLANGSWSELFQQCKPVMCPEPQNIENGNHTLNGRTYLSTVTYTCNNGYRLQGPSSLICESMENWNDTVPVCKVVSCGKPPTLANASIIGNKFTVGSNITYVCNEGHTLLGQESKECLPSGEWSQSSIQCVPVPCDNPPHIDNALPEPGNRLYGDTAYYYCSDGYSLADNSQLICNAQGQWSPPEGKEIPRCIADFCVRPADLPHAILESVNKAKYSSESVVNYKCKEGFVMNGSSTLKCLRGGQWMPSPLDIQCFPVRCTEPPNIEQGYINGNNYSFGSVIAYGCNKGYYIKGEKKRTCEATGEWSGSLPTCLPVSCGDPPKLENGYIESKGKFVYESQVTYNCNPGYKLVGSPVRVCQENHRWISESPPSCILLTCETPPPIKHGHYEGSTFEVGSKVEYVCDEGYELLGDAVWTCLKYGKWSKTKVPLCVPVQCSEPQLEQNHLVLISLDSNSGIIELACQEGYVLQGSSVLKCLSSQEWNDSFPVCKLVPCGKPPYVKLGEPLYSHLNFGSVVRYTCMGGLTLKKESSVTCLANGSWSLPIPECTAVECPHPEEIHNGIVDIQGLMYLNEALYSCKSGYELVGNSTLLCGEDGVWTGETPTCKHIECAAPEEIPNGKVAYLEVKFGHSVTYHCDRGFRLEGQEKRICLETGQWDSEVPKCKEIYCDVPQPIENGFVEGVDHSFGSTIIYSCTPGFQLAGHALLTCEESGWSSSPPVCLPTDCGLPPHIDFGEYVKVFDPSRVLGNEFDSVNPSPDPHQSYVAISKQPLELVSELEVTEPFEIDFLHGTAIVYSCNSGYELTGSSMLICQEDGFWNGSAPVCLPAVCEPPKAPEHGFVNATKNILGSVVEYGCKHGYKLDGQAVQQCVSGRRWSGRAPTCKLVSCNVPETLDNGSIEGDTFTYLSKIFYKCDSGFELKGPRMRACQANEQWDGYMPLCSPVSCGPPLVLENGMVIGSEYTYKTKVIYRCNTGFVLEGDKNSLCLSNGSWSFTAAVCRKVQCLEPPYITYGEFLGSERGYGAEIKYSCKDGYTLQGKSILKCQSDGSWDDKAPQCIPIVCDPPEDISHGYVNGSSFILGSHVYYVCFPGYKLIGNPILQCTAFGSWEGEVPSCKPCVCQPPVIENGYVTTKSFHCGEKVQFQCNKYFNLHGPTEAICESSGLWNPGVPYCGQIKCETPPSIPNTLLNGSSQLHKNAVTYRCSPGFVMSGSSHVICSEDGVWKEPYPVCQLASCGPPPPVPNAEIIGTTYTIGSKVQYRCFKGYEMQTEADAKICLQDGTWSTHNITCRQQSCPLPPKLATVIVTRSDSPSSGAVTISCLEGYELRKENVSVCQPNGTWAPAFQPDSCTPVSCGRPSPPLHGIVIGTRYSYKDKVQYFCQPGYKLQGNAERICQANKSWSGMDPVCSSLTCEIPSLLDKGYAVYDNLTVGSRVHYFCHEGHDLEGDPTAVCTGNGTWSVPQPACKAKRCPEPSGIFYDKASSEESFFVGQKLSVRCPKGYKIQGPTYITCESDLTWTPSAVKCEKIPCSSPVHVPNALIRRINFPSGDIIAYTCFGGYMLEGPSRITCLENGTWTSPPSCKAVCRFPCQNGGTCKKPNLCSCAEGWSGMYCEEPLCILPCLNGGKCIAPYVCRCPVGWSGSRCHNAVCQSPCLNGGKCIRPNRCHCPPGWSGHDCSRKRKHGFYHL
ncbi:LOW QUALITY PROTEIN: sushi, von Willebrand factor type A, EGF and pentraxin domain-containing protein 1 [Erpetoichthys calabaricus]|uniref:LOW QUALITY PROTEIN: sushi, von Willebrand factor type A, EGF and pentraxin domain-containing protein 1 n=1 Tax=Erpetoichthys calabaricus TaxID=27687 RepID=UPI002234E1DB|nr:LOW QUALITY PROTEIN: sushi, von Willebrand factor type A, EGF and pentraxin domain-containing protein 1 [Erpetoichthys calabaricus]